MSDAPSYKALKASEQHLFNKSVSLERQLAEVTKQRDAVLNSLQLVWKHLKGERIRHDYIAGAEETGDLKTLQRVCEKALAAVELEKKNKTPD